MKRIFALLLMLCLLCPLAFAEGQRCDTGSGTITLPDGWTVKEDNGAFSLQGNEGAMVLMINAFGVNTVQDVYEKLLPGIRAQLTQNDPSISFTDEGAIIRCGEREAIRYAFVSGAQNYTQYIIPVGDKIWYLTANTSNTALAEQVIASIVIN